MVESDQSDEDQDPTWMPPKQVRIAKVKDNTETMATGGTPITLEDLMTTLADMQATQVAATQGLRQELQAQAAAIQLLQAAVPPPPPDPNAQVQGNPQPGAPLVQVQGQPANRLRPLDINGLIKLPDRATTMQYTEYREWLKSWDLFSVRMQVPTYPAEEQSAALMGTFSPGYDHIYKQIIKPGMPRAGNAATVAETLTAVEAYIREDNGGLKDRMAFLQRKQQPNEDFAQFWADLQLLGQIAGPCNQCHETTLVNLVTIGVSDKELQHELLKERPIPNLKRCLAICQAHVASLRNAAAIIGTGNDRP